MTMFCVDNRNTNKNNEISIFFHLLNDCRLVADLAAQLITLGPWKIVYDQLRLMNAAWFEEHAIKSPEQLAGNGEPLCLLIVYTCMYI